MASSFRGLSIGVSGLFANQRALDVTGHNISNVNTSGYTRQMISNANAFSQKIGQSGNGKIMQIGYGVDVQEIRQYRDEFLDNKFKKENSAYGYWETRYDSVVELEAIFSDDTKDGMQAVMNNLWDSWEQLSKPSGGLTARALVKENAIAFIETVKNTEKMLIDFRSNKDKEIKERIQSVNDIAARIAALNTEIKKIENHGVTANDPRDERENLIDELSKIVKIQIIETDTINIAVEGRLLVDNNQSEKIMTVPDPGNRGYANLIWGSTGDKLNVTSGSLRSIIDCRDELTKGFGERLNELVKGVAAEINNLHVRGYGIKDDTHRLFFVNGIDGSGNNIDMSNIELNPELNEFDNIASAEAPFNVEDNRIALAISTIRQKDTFSADKYIADANSPERKQNSDEFYRSLIAELGNLGQEADTAAKAQQFLVEQVQYRRQAISAVSMDEEMSNLIRFEHSYSASARIVNTMDEMLEIIINKIGIVGR